MAVPVINITIEQSSDYASSFTITNPDGTPFNINQNEAFAVLRKPPDRQHAISGVTSEYIFTTAIDPDDGQIILTMNNTLTSTIPAGRYYYDIVIVDITDGYRSRVIQGMATVTPGVTLST